MQKLFIKIIIIVFAILTISMIIYYSDNYYEVIDYNAYSRLQDIEYLYGINYNVEDELLYSIKNKLIKKINREYRKGSFNVENNTAIIQYSNNQNIAINLEKLGIEDINNYWYSNVLYNKEKEFIYFVLYRSEYILCSYDIKNEEIKCLTSFHCFDYQFSSYTSYTYADNKIFLAITDNKIYIYDVIDMSSQILDITAKVFSVNKNGNLIAYIDNDNYLCLYNIESKISKIIRKIKREVGIIDIDDNGNFILLVEDSNIYSLLAGVDSHRGYKINFLNLYEVSTGKCQTIKKSGLFKVIRNAYFVDENINR